MHGLPFAALRDSAKNEYLVQKPFPIEIAGSATLYVFSLMRSRDIAGFPSSILLIGDPAFDMNIPFAQGLGRLHGALDEVNAIRGMYAGNVDVLTGEQATVAAFLANAQNKTLVHIAAHSVVNSVDPWRSLLLLAKTNDDSGVIEAQDLVSRLSLDHTRLVVLAACSSAGGLPVGPEGVAPLVRPLIAAGVPAVIGSLWDVDDATTKEFFVSFHRHYNESSDAAVALRAAQNDLLSQNRRTDLRSVMAWAPFQVIGHTAPNAAAP
jgi:CHAT domain-containing protein